MHANGTILAMFKDYEDAEFWSDLLKGFPRVIRLTPGEDPAVILENLRQLGIVPGLTIISTRLYPHGSHDMISAVRSCFPATDFLLVSSSQDPAPPLQPLVKDGVRHLVIDPVDPEKGDHLTMAAMKLLEGSAWKISDYLSNGASIHEFHLSSSEQKEDLISELGGLILGDSVEAEMLREKGALLADEMLENAMYGAPRDRDGEKIFQKGEKRAMLPGERIVFRFGFDGETLAMEVADGWGSLDPDDLMEHLANNQETAEFQDGMGGRGLFIIWRFMDQFHVSITPGRQTIVGGQLKLSADPDPFVPKGFHITACN